MKKGVPNWLMQGGAVVLLAAALGILLWQGADHVSKTRTYDVPQRIAAVTTQETVLSATDTRAQTAEIFAAVTTAEAASGKGSSNQSASAETSQSVTFPLNLNTASATELEQLPGIGRVLAQRITDYRESIGGYSNRRQLLEVNGIGEAKLGDIYDLVYVENETEASVQEAQQPETVQEQQAQEPKQEQADLQQESVARVSEESETAVTTTAAVELPLDLNRATADELMALPEMTEELAKKIVTLREEIGAYTSVYELLYVDGMTERYFTQIRDSVEIAEESRP